ncbi:hypothetical protein GCM10009743_53600 [Kribbella swartbergensis]
MGPGASPAEGDGAVGPLDAFGECACATYTGHVGVTHQPEEAGLPLRRVHICRLAQYQCSQQVWAVGCVNSPQPTCLYLQGFWGGFVGEGLYCHLHAPRSGPEGS